MAERIPVLIVGGGPVGLTASILLSRWSIPSILVERRRDVTNHPRSRAITIRSCEIFRSCGILEDLRVVSLPPEWNEQIVYATTLAGPELGRMRTSGWDAAAKTQRLTPATALMSSQDRIEPILRARAECEASASVRFHHELVALEATGSGARAVVRDGAGGRDYELEADYVIAADGAASPIRTRLGIPVEGQQQVAHLMNTYYRADLSRWVADRPAALYFVAAGAVSGVFQPLDGRDRWLCQIAYDPTTDPTESFTPGRCAAWIREAVGSADVELDIMSIKPWALGAAMATQFRAGPIFLAGDAAHQLPPTGGFGMNTGIQDAHNLAWKLAGVLQGWAGAELLDTYERERLPVARFNIARSFENFMMVAEIAGAARAQAEALARGEAAAGDPAAAVRSSRRYGNFIGQDLGFVYEDGAVVPDGTEPPPVEDPVVDYVPAARPGHRAPHVMLERAGAPVSTLDLYGAAFVLLAGPEGHAWIQAARDADTRVPLEAYRVASGGDVVDPAGDWLSSYGLTAAGAVLVRPDGHVAWRSAAGVADAGAALAPVLDAVRAG